MFDGCIEGLALLRLQVRGPEPWEKQLIDRRSSKSCRITAAQLRTRFLMQISSGHAIGRCASEDIVLVLSNTRRPEHAIPEIQLGFSKSGMAAKDLVLKGRRVRQ